MCRRRDGYIFNRKNYLSKPHIFYSSKSIFLKKTMTEPTKNDYLVLEAALKTEKSKVKELQDALKLSRKKLIEAEKKIMYHDKITKVRDS